MGDLVTLANEYFGKKSITLEPSEIKLLDGVEAGIEVDYRTGDKEKDDPANAKDWGQDRTIRAEIINWLCTDKKAQEFITHLGVEIQCAKIKGRIKLAYTILEYPLCLENSILPNGIELFHSEVKALFLNGSYINHEGTRDNCAIAAYAMMVRGNVRLDKATFYGETQLLGAEIDGQLGCESCSFINPPTEYDAETNAFFADLLVVKGSVIFRKANFEGNTRLLGANIGGQLNCRESSFINPTTENNIVRKAFSADGIVVKGNIVFNNAKIDGEARLHGAEVGGVIDCENALFVNSSTRNRKWTKAFIADEISVKSSIFFNDSRFDGEVRLLGANIGGQLSCRGGLFKNPQGIALNLQSARITDILFIDNIEVIQGSIDLTDTSINTLADDDAFWHDDQIIILDGFTYERIHCDKNLLTAKARLRWLECQPKDRFHPQPYDQLTKVYRKMGHEQDSRIVLIAKERKRRKHLDFQLKILNTFLDLFTGYGYQMWRVILFAILFITIGTCIFNNANHNRMMVPIKFSKLDSENPMELLVEKYSYPVFQPLVYSIDTFLPILDFQQESYWHPISQNAGSKWIWIYLYFHIAFGWFLTTIAITAITGLFRKE